MFVSIVPTDGPPEGQGRVCLSAAVDSAPAPEAPHAGVGEEHDEDAIARHVAELHVAAVVRADGGGRRLHVCSARERE